MEGFVSSAAEKPSVFILQLRHEHDSCEHNGYDPLDTSWPLPSISLLIHYSESVLNFNSIPSVELKSLIDYFHV